MGPPSATIEPIGPELDENPIPIPVLVDEPISSVVIAFLRFVITVPGADALHVIELLLPESRMRACIPPPPVYRLSASPFVKNSFARALDCVADKPVFLLNMF